MRVLLTGAKGQLGMCFKDRLPENWELIATDSQTLDITDAQAVAEMVRSFEPDAIVNAAAYTAVDKAEAEPEKAFSVNAKGTLNLALAAQAVNALFIHVSTDYVFDGKKNTPYKETDAPNPQGVYGQSKLAGELLALANYPRSIIIRTAWVFSEYGHNFVKTMLRLGREREELGIVGDQFGCPTYAGDLAQAIITMLTQGQPKPGIYHYSGDKAVSWFEFAQEIFQAADPAHKLRLNKITTAEFPTPATRPAYSILNLEKATQANLTPSNWQAALKNKVIPYLKLQEKAQ